MKADGGSRKMGASAQVACECHCCCAMAPRISSCSLSRALKMIGRRPVATALWKCGSSWQYRSMVHPGIQYCDALDLILEEEQQYFAAKPNSTSVPT
jgi:hypothetical protein